MKIGYPCKSEKDIDSVKSTEYDALIIPGGFAPDYWRRDKRFVGFVQEMHKDRKPIASICHGPWMLVKKKKKNF